MQIYDTSTYQSREHLARLERARVEARAATPGHGQELTVLVLYAALATFLVLVLMVV